MNEDVERFLAKAKDLATPTSPVCSSDPPGDISRTVGDGAGSSEDQWEEFAPGVDPSAYNPKPLPPIPVDSPAVPTLDIGKIPLGFQPSSSKTDIEDYFGSPGVCGLLNLGNTCYMNAGLQCVFSVKRIAEFYISDHVPKPSHSTETEEGVAKETPPSTTEDDQTSITTDSNSSMSNGKDIKRARTESDSANEGNPNKDKKEGPETAASSTGDSSSQSSKDTSSPRDITQGQVTFSFSHLMRKLWTGHYKAIVPNNFKTVLGFIYSQFNGFRQQDCQEFLVVLLDRLNEELCHYSKLNKPIGTTDPHHDDSIITDTFQGELKNEVTCCRCGHVSTKMDPFMYLSLPIPHAHERQLEITWSPTTRSPFRRKLIKCLVVIPKVSTVHHVKQALCELLGGAVSPDYVTLAHVKNSCIEYTLGDSLASNRVKDTEFLVYGFETDSQQCFTAPPSTSPPPPLVSNATSEPQSPSYTNEEGYTPLRNEEPMEIDRDASMVDPWKPLETNSGVAMDIDQEATPLLSEQEFGETTPTAKKLDEFDNTPFATNSSSGAGGSGSGDGGSSEGKKVVVMEWHSCGICLEEMVDSDLLTHPSCGAVLCSECLESSKHHTVKEDGRMPCPVCQVLLDHSKDFVPLAEGGKDTSEQVVRLLQITVLFRQEDSSGNWSTFGHPALVNLPQSESIDYYYKTVSTLVPAHFSNQAWNLALTDGKARFCSRCLYNAQCRGCILSNAMEDITLKPGDHLSVSFRHLPEDTIEKVFSEELEHHSSYNDSNRWPSTVSLDNCLQLFSQREVLGTDNPWWCPECKCNQEAIRQLMISQLPSTIIVHLKRFLFQDSTANKIDTGIAFPLSLPSSALANDCIGQDHTPHPTYDLTGCVCHFGTLNSGHYTAYSMNPATKQWYYCNDESVTEKIPSEADSSSAYILFYTAQQENESLGELPNERGVVSFNPEEELVYMGPLLRLMKPKPAPPPPPVLPPLKRASSLGDVTVDNVGKQVSKSLAAGLPLVSSMMLDHTSLFANNSPNITAVTDKHVTSSTSNGSVKFKSFEI